MLKHCDMHSTLRQYLENNYQMPVPRYYYTVEPFGILQMLYSEVCQRHYC